MGRQTRAYRRKVGPHLRDARVAELAAGQHGVVSLEQLHESGLSEDAVRWRVGAGRLHRLHRGVYAVGHRALSRAGRDLAAVLACGSAALLSHRSAAASWRLLRWGRPIEVSTLRSGGPRRGITVHRTRRLDLADRATIDAIPVTSLARTLVDLAEVLSEQHLANAVHEAEVQRLFDLGAVREAQARVPGRAGRYRLDRVLAAYAPRPFTRSEAEKRFLGVCAAAGLPKPRSAVSIGGHEVDFLWPDRRVAVEVDGAAVHLTQRAFHEDRSRDRELAVLGYQTLRVTWRDLLEPDALGRQLRGIVTDPPRR